MDKIIKFPKKNGISQRHVIGHSEIRIFLFILQGHFQAGLGKLDLGPVL